MAVKRLGLLAVMAALFVMAAAAVWVGSPYAPVIAPAPQEIEVLWDIEDARQESDKPLVTALENHGVPLAYSEAENRFYCTLGLETGDDWPQLHLTAPGAKGVSLIFSDDYSYDWCADAVKEGYSYQVMAYTDTEFAYFEIVFTGLPIVSFDTNGEAVTALDTQAQIGMSVFGKEALASPGRVHVRGDRSVTWKPKAGYKLEFTRGGDSGKVLHTVDGLGDVEEAVLLPIAIDSTMMRDRLSWDMVSLAFDHSEGFGGLPCRYVELFVNGSYEGVYLLLKPFDIGDEMRKAGADAIFGDSLYRVSRMEMVTDRQILPDPTHPEIGFELFYAPDMAHGFDALTPYIGILTEEDEAAFTQKALRHIDLDSLLRYELIMQAGAMVDNAANNLYIWAHNENGNYRYRFSFWDMDLTWGLYAGDLGDRWVELPIADRVIEADVGGAKRRIGEIWENLKTRGFTSETVEALVEQYVHKLGDSGAFMRDSQRWEKGSFYPDGYEIVDFAGTRFAMIDEWVASLAAESGRE